MAAKLETITFTQLTDYAVEDLEWARKTIAKEIDRRQGGEFKKLKRQFAKLAGSMGYTLVTPEAGSTETGTTRGRKRGRQASPAVRQERRGGSQEEGREQA
jgi:hypothetical protein